MDPVCIERTIPAPLDRVYAAWTDARLLSQWFFPGTMTCEASCDFRVGGQYRLEMRNANGSFTHHGHYREIIALTKIVFTWSSHLVRDTLVTVSFSGTDETTHLKLVHELISDAAVAEEHRGGWQGCLDNLNALVVNNLEEVAP
jgi:uncharacterized protein YndB with AHSA1/START domain